jgi:hypothetical protein
MEYGSRKCGYFSWSPESHYTNNNNYDNNNIVGISATYAQKLGVKDKEMVMISLCSDVSSVSRINVSPVTADDWEILVSLVLAKIAFIVCFVLCAGLL